MQNRESRNTSPEALQARLQVVAERHSLSEISRRTGAPLASVSRYFRGTRVPADFCGALGVHFGVNPSWLLTGEGTPWISDIPERTSAMAGDLLELVEAMNAVNHMRLGALTGKHHLRVLRELNEALVRFEELRARLNDHARPVLTRLLSDMETAVRRMDVDRAGDLYTAIQQVRRFCDDRELEYKLERLGATLELMRHDPSESLRHQQRVFGLVLIEGRLDSNAALEETIRLAMLLSETGREEDAVALCKAAVELIGDRGSEWESYPFLKFLTGQLMANNLQLYAGIELMQRWLPLVKGDTRVKAARHVLAFALLYAGLVEPDEAFDVGGDNEVKALNLLYYAIFREDRDYLLRALRYFESRQRARKDLAPMGYIAEYAHILAAAMEKPSAAQAQKFKKLKLACKDDARVSTELELLVFETQLLRKLKRLPAARKAMHAAQQLIAKPRKPSRALLVARAIHNRNALELDKGELRKSAERFFEAHREAGYRAFNPESEPSPSPAQAGSRSRGRRA